MTAAGLSLPDLMRVLGTPSDLSRTGFSAARMAGLRGSDGPALVARLAGLGMPLSHARMVLADPTAGITPPFPSPRRHCPGCTCHQNEEP